MTPQFLPHDATWIGVLLLIVVAIFLAAAVIGGVARAVMPERYVDEPDDAGNHGLEEREEVGSSEAPA